MKHILNKLSILLLLLLMAATTQAQQNRKFHVQSFEQNQFDTSARVKATEKYDGNGDRYSIIKVTSTNPDDDLMAYSFDFGMMNSLVEQHNGELWVYVQRNAKHVTISRAGYVTIRDYDLRTTIQPGLVFDMVLSPEAAKISRQMLLFEVRPAASQAFITYKREGESDYKVFGNGNVDESGMAAMSLELGAYIYKIISQKYHPTEGRVVLNTRNGKYVEQVALRPNFANVTLNTIQGADIYIDDVKKGTGSWTGELNSGTYSIECRKESHESSYQTITVEDGKNRSYQLLAPTPITGTLSLMSLPLNATITIDGKNYGTTPMIIDELLIGTHKVTLSKQGYVTTCIDVIVKKDDTTEQNVTLKHDVSKKSVSVDQVKNAGLANNANRVSVPRPNEIVCIACTNIKDGSIAYFTGVQWEMLAENEKSLYAQLGVSVKENDQEFIISANDCNDNLNNQYKFGGLGIDFTGVLSCNEGVVESQFICTGYSDTKAMVEQQRGKKDKAGTVGVPAAEAAWDYKANGYDKYQWYLPSVSELKMIYRNKNDINKILSEYIAGASNISADWYWSSTEYKNDWFWYLYMNNGESNYYNIRNLNSRVRAVTRLDISETTVVNSFSENKTFEAKSGNKGKSYKISKPRDPNELLCIVCVNKNDGSISYFTGGQWEILRYKETLQYAQLGVSIKQNGHEFIVAANDCSNSEKLKFGGCGVDFLGVASYDRKTVKSQYVTTGYNDTDAIVELQRLKKDSKGIHGAPAAEAAWSYKTSEYDDLQWYLPSISELQIIYNNKKAINKFLSKYIYNAAKIETYCYWSSSKDKATSWCISMSTGFINDSNRDNKNRVRAVAVIE